VRAGESEANGASVLELAMMAAGPGTTLVITAEGDRCAEAVVALANLVRNDFKP
jgi:phosphotransferase system HPr-like phosphotransfer protein